ncbi:MULTISPECIES: DUF3618 domain-containing protein [Nocardia]|uniref:DUF3618 domain-containing protein n=1 Tax=Nocardia TaxID=1817 RepID=UPI001357CCD0|nr:MULTISPECIES: DUF3618 domain-containing protein [Nocardia]
MSDSRSQAGRPADDVAALRRDRDQAREDLGRTVEELGHKLDVPARGKEKAHDAVEATQHAASEAALAVTEKAQQARTAAAGLAHRAVEATPEPVAVRGKQAGAALRAHPIPAALGAAVITALVWQIARRRR